MILWFRKLPQREFDSTWEPFITPAWLRQHFIKFSYGLALVLMASIFCFSRTGFDLGFPHAAIFVSVFLLHEILHLLVIFRLGDISITFRSGLLWINTNAEMRKVRFFFFMALPIIALSLLPLLMSLFLIGAIRSYFIHIALLNLAIASSDLIKSILILLKPNSTLFCCGYCRMGGARDG